MMRASTNITDKARERWLFKVRNPSYVSARVQRVKKEPGSLELSLGKWVEINGKRS